MFRVHTDVDRFFVVAGPCVIESREQCLQIASHMKAACARLNLPYIFKASFDKANRSSVAGFRGPGIVDGLAVLRTVKAELDIPILTDIHEPNHAQQVADSVDVLQIPAFLARQTDLLVAAGRTGKAINVKKGQFMSPSEMALAVEKIRSVGGKEIWLTERGTFFGYNRLVNDFTGLHVMAQTGCPVVFDVTHSTQQPAGLGSSSGGNPQYAPLLARSAIAAGAQGLFLECHPDPKNAKSDAATVLPLHSMEKLLTSCAEIAKLRKAW